MEITDSDQVPLEAQARIKAPRHWRRTIETLFIVCSLFLGGFGTGFVYRSRTADADVSRMREDHISEIERLQEAHQFAISSLTRSSVKAAESAAVASDKATAAVEAVGDVAKKIERSTAQKKVP